MKYYIVLSSLNVDNVLSSESISPFSFYGKRDFGYKSFQKVDGITYANDIVLFSQIPYFEIRDSERENYPMIIEIEDDNQLDKIVRKVKNKKSDCDIYICNQSIYLNPWNCKLLFFTKEALLLSKLKCEDSLCNKLSELFRLEVIIPNKLLLLSDILKGLAFEESSFNLDKLVLDNKINRIKGYLYGYYLGYTKSLTSNTAQLLSIQKRIYNIVASIINNKGESNDSFNDELRKLDSQYNDIDPHKKELRQLWNDKILSRFSSANDKNTFESILRELYIESDAKYNFCRLNNIMIRKIPFSTSNKYFDWASYQNELSSYTQNIIYEEKVKRPSIDLSKEFDVKDDYSSIILKSEEASLYNKIVSKFFLNDVTTIEDLRLSKLDIATEYTKGIKSIMQSENIDWDNSPERGYLNSLRQNIAKSEPFNLQDGPGIITMSIAAFLLKGEDFDALNRFLEGNGMSEYKYVLGFWGLACGYADIPKPIFKPLINEKESFCKIYKSINGLLFNTALIGSFPEITKKYIYPHLIEVNGRSKNLIEESQKSDNRNFQYKPIKQKLVESFLYVQKNLSKKIKDDQIIAINNSIEIATTPENFLVCLKKNGIKSNTNLYKLFETYLVPNKEKKDVSKLNLFPEITNTKIINNGDLSFLKDSNRWNLICTLISDDKCLKQFKIDMEWFLENHNEIYLDKKGEQQQGIYFGKSTDNKAALERFEIYLNNKRENKLEWLSDIYKKIPIDHIIKQLRNIYK
jgi:hypothetical protein